MRIRKSLLANFYEYFETYNYLLVTYTNTSTKVRARVCIVHRDRRIHIEIA